MTGGITSVPLPAYWSSKDPEQWRRYPLKALTCTNPRCAANNANYATIFNDRPAKRPRRPYKASSRSRSISATSKPSTPLDPERNSKIECGARCSDCNAPLVPLARTVSSSTTLTPPTPLQVRSVAPGPYVARLNRSPCTPSYGPPRIRETPPYFHKRSIIKKPNSSAPPPSECGEYSSEEPGFSLGKVVRLSDEVGIEYVKDPDPVLPYSSDQAAKAVDVTDPGTPASLPPHSENKSHKVLPNFTRLSVNETTIEVKRTGSECQHRTHEHDTGLSRFNGDDVGSESSASATPSEKCMNLSNGFRAVCDRNRISSFYNVLYTPDVSTSDEKEIDLNMRRGRLEHDLKFKMALAIGVLSAFVTILILACFPSFLSGVRFHVLGCCSCTYQTAASANATTPSPHFGQLKLLEGWKFRGPQSLLGCRSPRQALGSTLMR